MIGVYIAVLVMVIVIAMVIIIIISHNHDHNQTIIIIITMAAMVFFMVIGQDLKLAIPVKGWVAVPCLSVDRKLSTQEPMVNTKII